MTFSNFRSGILVYTFLYHKKIQLPSVFYGLKFISLVLLLLVLLVTKMSRWFTDRFLNLALVIGMKWSLWAAFLLAMLAGIFSYRFFCLTLCPIRTLGLLFRLMRKDN